MKKISFYIGRKNTVTFFLASAVLLFGIYSFFGEVVYFFSGSEAIDLKDAMEIDKANFEKVDDGDFVQVKGITSVQGGAIQRGITGTEYILYYLTGSSKFIINEKNDGESKGPQYKTVRGRAYKFSTNSNAARMRNFFARSFMIEMDEDGILIEAGLEPGSDYAALIFFIMLIAAMGLNIYLFIRPLKQKEDPMENDIDEI
ncbi:MAG TPA: hypothetical protein PLX56_06075 [bacterium]|nr:hypothetical protein [bacterium]HQO91878.1 hypothetical protein [bacterium]